MTEHSDMLALAPCPFCGGAVKLETYSADYKRIEFCVMCHECDFSTAEGLTAEDTAARWNTRASTGPAASRLGRWLAAALDDPNVCVEMKADVNAWFEAGEPVSQSGEAAMREACAAVVENRMFAIIPDQMSKWELIREFKKICAAAIRALPLPSDDGEVRS